MYKNAYINRIHWEIFCIIKKTLGEESAKDYLSTLRKRKSAPYKSAWNFVCFDEDGINTCRYEKQFVPYHLTEEEKEVFREENEIRIFSPYDCTGKIFTVWIDFYEIPKGTWIYHCKGIDL